MYTIEKVISYGKSIIVIMMSLLMYTSIVCVWSNFMGLM